MFSHLVFMLSLSKKITSSFTLESFEKLNVVPLTAFNFSFITYNSYFIKYNSEYLTSHSDYLTSHTDYLTSQNDSQTYTTDHLNSPNDIVK